MMTMVTMEMIIETNHNMFNGLKHFAICCCFFCGVSVAITWIYLVICCGDDKFVIFFRTYCQFLDILLTVGNHLLRGNGHECF